jgi:penicillin amidase
MRRFKRFFVYGLAYFAVSLVVSSVAGYFWLRSSLPQMEGEIRLDGVRAPVEVMRDKEGVPHIFAAHAEDAIFALGFVHAQDRLWQMEAMRRMGAGRLSEVFGKPALELDRFIRMFDIYRLAEAQVAGLNAKERAIVDAYTAGVNAFLEKRSGALPPEFLLLRHEPEPWKPADSLVWSRLMALQLSGNSRDEVIRLRLAQRLNDKQIEELWPDGPDGAPVTLSEKTRAASLPLDLLWRAWPKALRPVDASNAWVLDGNRTATGKPILANDPHLGFSAPILWYLAHIEAPGLSLVGATVPGVPLLILGHNGHIAWGMTTTGSDTKDFFLETVDPKDPARYLTPDGSEPFQTRTEKIRVRNKDPVTLTVRETRHGPVYSDVVRKTRKFVDDQHVLALATPVLKRDDRTAHALFEINRARNWNDFLAAARDFHSPQQNLFYADTKGDIGLIAPGRIPVRRSGDGRNIAVGATGELDWTGFLPFEALPRQRNPKSGFIVNANNRLVRKDFPHLLTVDWEAPFRAERIAEIIGRRHGLSLLFSARLQLDTLSPAARRLAPLLLAAQPRNDRERKAVQLLRKWDFRMDRNRPEPLIYATWLRELGTAMFADELEDVSEDFGGPYVRLIESVLTRNRHWCDDVTTDRKESCKDQLALALGRALDAIAEKQGSDMGAWRWGDLHRAVFQHQVFTHLPILRDFGDRSIETDGGSHTVNRGQTSGQTSAPYDHVHGAGYRAVYDLSKLSRSRFMIATGQSGNPFSPYYDNLMRRWRDGGFLHIAGTRNSVRERAAGVLVLNPIVDQQLPGDHALSRLDVPR